MLQIALRPQRTLPLGDPKNRLSCSPAKGRDLPKAPSSPLGKDGKRTARPPPRAAVFAAAAPPPPPPEGSRSCPNSPKVQSKSPTALAQTYAAGLRTLRLRKLFEENLPFSNPATAASAPLEPSSSKSSTSSTYSEPIKFHSGIERRPLPKKSKSCPLLLDIANMREPSASPPVWSLRSLVIAA